MADNIPVSIYLAEDSEDDALFFMHAARKANSDLKFNIFDDGIKLLQYMQQNPDISNTLLLLDINMPGMSGFECLKHIRASFQWQVLPVIMYSTSASKADIIKSIELGANLYIRKPEHLSTLTEIIKSLLLLDWSKEPAAIQEFVYD